MSTNIEMQAANMMEQDANDMANGSRYDEAKFEALLAKRTARKAVSEKLRFFS